MTDPTPSPPPRQPHQAPPWWLRFPVGAALLAFEVSPWNSAGFRAWAAIIELGLMGVLSFARVDLAEMVRGYLPPPAETPPQAPPSPPGPPPGPEAPPTAPDGATSP